MYFSKWSDFKGIGPINLNKILNLTLQYLH